MFWTGGAKKRLKEVIDKKVNDFDGLSARKEQAYQNYDRSVSEPMSDEQLIPLFYFALVKMHNPEVSMPMPSKPRKDMLDMQLREIFDEEV